MTTSPSSGIFRSLAIRRRSASSASSHALDMLEDLRGPVEKLLAGAGAHDGACDCGSAKRALQYIGELRDSLQAGGPLGEEPWGIDETLDDVLCCAATHASGRSQKTIDSTRELLQELLDLAREVIADEDGPVNNPARLSPRRSSLAERAAHAAVRILPSEYRNRYRDEYHSELHDLATEGVSALGQICHALRLLDRTWVLRAELRDAASQRARS